MISFTAMVIITVQTTPILPTPPLDVLLFGTSSIPMDHVCQAVPTLIEMNGMMDLISATLLALTDTLML